MVINSTNINKTKESLNSDSHQFHQYQQNKRKFKQWWSSIPPISTKQRKFKQWWSSIPPISTKQSSLLTSNHWTFKMATMFDVGNSGSGLRQAYNWFDTSNNLYLSTIHPSLYLYTGLKTYNKPEAHMSLNHSSGYSCTVGLKQVCSL